ncbi:hypothetical protein [Bacillus infantis]|uniref:hypothetical protein n=1 Tax=Bacillus infantis TaxID=324767 RepID=UPI003CEFC173
MTFKKGFILGYLVFILLMALVYITIPREYTFISLITVGLLFGFYQIVLSLKVKKKINKNA